ncbi:MAG: response regulator [Candidatus Eisenbacteria bacterium]|nr:response regulator [Candidatus Eisenbacteria bacterium]
MSHERILIVEDEDSLRKVLKLQLEHAGYEVETAEDGIQGLESVRSRPPDLVLLDVMMPRMDGSEVCRRLKANFLTSQIPVIMLTALGGLKDKVAGLDVGANDYLTKPHSREELLARMRNILQWSRLQRQANPLTGLPGNAAIEAAATQRIESGAEFAFLYIDLDHFKAFNDYYSYQAGDDVIRWTASVILGAVAKYGSKEDFVGHVGGDDFVAFSTPEHARAVAAEIVREFDEKVPSFYSEEDRERGFVMTTNRQNVLTKIPLMTVTIAGVTSIGRVITHIGQLSDIAAELKRYGKSRPGSVVVWERRGD